jgi:hypothetical protein
VFRLVDYINEKVVPEIIVQKADSEVQTETITEINFDIDYKIKRKYEDKLEECSRLK